MIKPRELLLSLQCNWVGNIINNILEEYLIVTCKSNDELLMQNYKKVCTTSELISMIIDRGKNLLRLCSY